MLGGRKVKGSHMAVHALWIADEVVKVKGQKDKMLPVAIDVEDKDSRDPLGGLLGPVVHRFIPPLSMNLKKHIIYSPK
jgi:hypothetical protein